jgi:hypothetical protein
MVFVDQVDTGDQPAQVAAAQESQLEAVKFLKRRKVLCSCLALSRRGPFRMDGSYSPPRTRLRTIAANPRGFHILAFVMLLLKRFVELLT